MREYLTFYDLAHSRSVFDAEAGMGGTGGGGGGDANKISLNASSSSVTLTRDRAQLAEGLGMTEMAAGRAGSKAPILQEILRLSKVSVLKSETPTPTERYKQHF